MCPGQQLVRIKQVNSVTHYLDMKLHCGFFVDDFLPVFLISYPYSFSHFNEVFFILDVLNTIMKKACCF
jgi:hypothetical protein